MKSCTPLWCEAHFQVKMYKTHQHRTTFWKLRCRESARRRGAKHISKSKCTKHTILGPLLEVEMSRKCTPLWREAHFQVKMSKHTILGPLLEVEMSKKCTPLWREAHFQVNMYKTHHSRTILEVEMSKKCTPLWRKAHFEVKMYKTPHVRATFGGSDLEKVHAVVARSTFPSQNVQSTPASDHFWRFRCRFASLRVITLHYTLHYTTVHYTTLHSTTLQLQLQNYTTTLHYTPLH